MCVVRYTKNVKFQNVDLLQVLVCVCSAQDIFRINIRVIYVNYSLVFDIFAHMT